MKVVVLGSGVIGVTSAYYLAKAGHEVTVVDRQPGPALETSFANAGEISPGYASPWAAPGVPLKALKWLFMQHAPLIVRPNPDPAMYLWMLQMLANCTHRRYAINKGRMVRVAEYSRDALKELRAETGIAYDERTLGTLQLFRTQAQLDHAQDDIAVLKQYGVAFELLDKAGALAAEPGLARSTSEIAGGLRLPGDETGDCFIFTNKLAEKAAAMGVVFQYGTQVTGIQTNGGRVTGIATDKGLVAGDAYLLAMGSFSSKLGKTIGVNLPIYPVKGYSITVPIVDEAAAPVSTVLDESFKIAITRLGDRVRVGGMAELSGYNSRLSESRRETLEHSLGDLFPGATEFDKSSFWTGMRPMTPDSTPIIGKAKYDNLFVNSGHGTLGWTMACGSGRIVTDLISGTRPDVDASDLGPDRYAA